MVTDPCQRTNIAKLWNSFAEISKISIEKHIPVRKPAPEKAITKCSINN